MPKKRLTTPRPVRDKVLKLFNHRCAVCGGDHPQIHHIDEDPANNAPENLLPVCPNCHLNDLHDPTRPMEPGRLLLFRLHRDPAILKAQFEPLYRRTRFLFQVEVSEEPTDDVRKRCTELTAFVASLDKGEFYASQIEALVHPRPHIYSVRIGGGYDPEAERQRRRVAREYREQIVGAREKVMALVVELLRFQHWQ